MRAIEQGERTIVRHDWGLILMFVVLGVNLSIALWQGYWARRLRSDILRADARHTMADVMTTVAVIAGWQFAARGYAWLDTLFALVVAAFVMVLAYSLFRRAVPILVDRIAEEPEALIEAVRAVVGVRKVRRVRSRWAGSEPVVDVIITVDPHLPTDAAHAVADRVETVLRQQFAIEDATVHIEPDR